MFGMLSVLAEFQRELIVANTRDGLEAAGRAAAPADGGPSSPSTRSNRPSASMTKGATPSSRSPTSPPPPPRNADGSAKTSRSSGSNRPTTAASSRPATATAPVPAACRSPTSSARPATVAAPCSPASTRPNSATPAKSRHWSGAGWRCAACEPPLPGRCARITPPPSEPRICPGQPVASAACRWRYRCTLGIVPISCYVDAAIPGGMS